MKKRKCTFIIHDPNPPEVTADRVLKMFIEANKKTVEEAIINAAKNNLHKE